MVRLNQVVKKVIILSIIIEIAFPSIAQSKVKSYTTQSETQENSVVKSQELRELQIGDHVPDVALELVNYKTPKVNLSEFKGKNIILDFWATWCSACIDAFPKAESLQKTYKDKLQIILVNTSVTHDDKKRVLSFFNKWKQAKGNDFSLPSAILDSTLAKLFPHTYLPHYVWIGSDNQVKAITASEELTSDNIRKFLEEKPIPISPKIDFRNEKLLYLGDKTRADSLSRFSFFIKGELVGLEMVNSPRVTEDLVFRGWAFRNCSMWDMFYQACRLHKAFDHISVDPRIMIESADSIELKKLISALKREICTYDMVVPVSEAETLSMQMLKDLNHYSDYWGRIEKRTVECFVIENDPSKPNNDANLEVNDKNEKYVSGTLDGLTYSANAEGGFRLPVINEAILKGQIKIKLASLYNIDMLRNSLSAYGIRIVNKKREVEMFVISKKVK